ncbi:response regulator [Rhizobium sp. BK376]|uniref:response regulator n=1 Tax=Rhizobium sp. BK376 TaxID=2512149 RepID=UPI00105078E9|nr:response regulator [Rhizobium sp. BK376]TCR92924.1 response regulator receiver domain-containing protein [Rhizobium sp. BK376]
MNGRILIVEDDALIAMVLEDMLSELSYEVAGKAADLNEALALAGSITFDAAVLDVSLAGKSSLPVAKLLDEKGKPYLFATGYGSLPDGMASGNHQVLNKPYQLHQLKAALASLKTTS